MQLKFAKLGALFSRFYSALRTPHSALALALAFAALAPFCGHAANPLPDGYRRIAYIESSVAGKQYITIPAEWYVYKQSLPNVITMVGEFTARSTEYQNPCGFSTHGFDCLGIRRSDDPTPANQNKFGNDAFQSHPITGSTQKGELAVPFNEQATITWKFGNVDGNTSWQSLEVVMASGQTMITKASQPLSADDWEKPLTLFAAPQPVSQPNAGEVNSFSNFRLYGATVTLNDQLKVNLIPALNSDGDAGLYDTVHSQFLTTQGATPFDHPQPEQWFRFTILKRKDQISSDNITQLDELVLCTSDGENVAQGLSLCQSGVTEIGAGSFRCCDKNGVDITGANPERLFDGRYGTTGTKYGKSGLAYDYHQVFTIHLPGTVGTVVKYNLLSANDHMGRTPSEWTLERSYDGVNWEMVDDRSDENTSGYATSVNTWYNNGGTYNATTGANSVPSNFYWLFDLPLPKLSRTVYAHTGAPISPEIVEKSQYYTLSGDTNATQVGKYKIVCTPEPGLAWENGSTEPCELEWEIVNDPFPLPAGYTRLEWIKSTRQQRLLTDYYPNPKTWMEVDCMFTGAFQAPGDFTTKFCDANEGNAPYSIAFTDTASFFNELICWVDQSVSGGIWLNSASFPQATGSTSPVDESVCRNLLTISNGVSNSTLEWTKAGLAIDRGAGGTGIERPIPRKTTTCTKRLALFGTAEKNFGTYDMTVWSWKIYESDSGSGVNDPTSHLVHNFIPAMSPDGVPGLWDTVTGEFRASATDTPFAYQNADQWFRLSITQTFGGDASLEFTEFALYDAAGVRQNLNLKKASDIDHIGPGEFYHDNKGGNYWPDTTKSGAEAFDGKLDTWLGVSMKVGTYDSATGVITDPQVLIMHLTNGAPEVVKYNLATGHYISNKISPVAWTLERSYDGRNWTEIIRKTKAGCDYPLTGLDMKQVASKTWYRNGGTGEAPTTYFPAGNWGEGADQWFRLTIRKKYNKEGDDYQGKNSLQLDEFALFDAEGKRQDIDLEPNGVSAASLWPGEWYYQGRGDAAGNPTIFWGGQSPSKMFDANLATKWGVDYGQSDLSPLGGGQEDYWQVLTLRLPVGTSEVVSYNLCSGSDTGNFNSRAPTSWVLERSSDGENWVVFDEKTEADHQYTLESSTWYGNGGTGNDPTNVFWIVKLPLPKLGQTVYSYTGAPISPKMMEESEFYTLSGVTNATNEGTYKLVCTPISGLTWANGSTGPYELVWQIVPETFLQRVASDPKRVDEETVDFETPYAKGGDIVLQIGNEYVHVFTNGTDRTFTAKTELANARLLLVGGGGSGGSAYQHACGGGGGAGGMVEQSMALSASAYLVTVGMGGAAIPKERADPGHGNTGGNSAFKNNGGDELALAYGGGGGGLDILAIYVGTYPMRDSAIGGSGGCGGGHSSWCGKNELPDLSNWLSPAPGTAGQGYAGGLGYNLMVSFGGWSGAGGGGAGGPGGNATPLSFDGQNKVTSSIGGAGGIGRASDILGWTAFFAGGGAGGTGEANKNRAGFAAPGYAVGGVGGGGSTCTKATYDALVEAGDAAGIKLIFDGSDGQGGGGAAATGLQENQECDSGKGGDGIVIIRYQIPDTTLLATPPVAKTGLTYNGKTQVGVPEGVGYTLKEAYYYATAVGTYTTTATLLPGYVWNDNGSTAPRDYEWRIEGLRISSVKLVASEAQWTGGDIIPQVAYVTTVDGLTITDASVGWTVSYERERVATTDFKQVGNISVVVTGTGSLSGEVRANFRIYDPKKIPLPKLLENNFTYTGSEVDITSRLRPLPSDSTYELGGSVKQTDVGTYTVVCTPANGRTWENGSSKPLALTWKIGESFLQRLENDSRKVGTSPYATGGSLILHDAEQGVYIHVFTNCTEAATFKPTANLNAWVLAIGGGGGGGSNDGGGGGAGGMVEDESIPLAQGQDVSITVGAGAAGTGSASAHGGDGSPSQIEVPGMAPIIAYGGGGGGYALWNVGFDGEKNSGHGGDGFGSGGGSSATWSSYSVAGVGNSGRSTEMYKGIKQGYDGGTAFNGLSCPAGGGGGAGAAGASPQAGNNGGNLGGEGGAGRRSDILGFCQYFAGGGGGGGVGTSEVPSDPRNVHHAAGGVGGGGDGATFSAGYAVAGENGLGGGGGGGKGGNVNGQHKYGAAGGDGIVIVRYVDPSAGLKAPVPVGKVLNYNGMTQIGVDERCGSTLSSNYYGDAEGEYTAVATLAPGYTKWADDSTALSREITWEIYVPSVVASAEDVEQEYDGNSHSITVTVTDPADATVTYSLTEDGEYTPSNPSFTEFGAYRVYWMASKDNYTGAKGSAVVRIGKKAAGEYVRLRITQRTGGPLPDHKYGGEYSVSFAELALYSDAAGTSRFGKNLVLASDLNALKSTRGTCFCTLPDREPNYANSEYCGATVVRLFDEKNYTSILCEGCDFKVEERPSSNAHLMIYMHLSADDAAKVIRSYDLQGASGVEGQSNYSPTAWRLEVSSDCEHWTVIDEKTVADTAGNMAIMKNSKWYGKEGSDDKKAYPINLDYAPLEYFDTNPGEANYLQVVGFQLEDGNAVTARVQYDGALSGDKDTLFCQRDLDGKGTFAAGRSSSGLWLDYGTASRSGAATLTDGIVELVAGASGLKLNGASVITAPGTALTAAPNNSPLLFAADDPAVCDGVPAVNAADLKCYGFQVANSATDPTLRLDLMPASNTVTHAQGLYDRVSGNFYPLQKVAEAGQQPFTSATIASHYAKPMTVKMGDTGWDQLPILTEVDERLASVTNYLTSIPNYWQQEWVPGMVDHAGEYRQILRGQGPYAGEVTNVYAVGIEVALNANGGTAGATNSVLAVPGRSLPAITGEGALPTMTDSMFAGYWSEQTGGEKYYNADGTSAKDYPATGGPSTLYAHWRQGIKPLAKLNFDGKHFILTDYVPQETTWIETEMQAKRDGASSQIKDQSFFGLAEMHEIDSSSYTLYYTMNYAGYSAQIYGWALSTGNDEGKGRGWNLSPSDGAMLNSGKCLVRFGYSGFEVSNQTSGIKKATQDDRMKMQNYFPCTSTLVIGGLGGALPNASSGSQPGYGRPVQPYKSDTDYLDVYSFKIYESENGSPDDAGQTLVRDYIPVTNTIAMVAGLYDVINEVFYPLKTQTIVTLNANGGNQPTNYVYATAGEAMPSPIAVPTRPGYEFAGYTCAGWEARLMTGSETDICSEGTTEFAYMCTDGTLNGVTFNGDLQNPDASELVFDFGRLIHRDFMTHDTTGQYAELMKSAIYANSGNGLTTDIKLSSLKVGHYYLFQFFVHDGRGGGQSDFEVSVDQSSWYQFGQRTNPTTKPEGPTRSKYGVTFVYRFVATAATETVKVYFRAGDGGTDDQAYAQFNGVQLRDITGVEGSSLYYNAEGTSDKTYPTSGGPTTLTAMWEPAKYRMINRETGPERAVDYEWLNGVFGEKDQAGYQEALFETNANGVVAWQAYILGVDAAKTAVDGAAIVEETVQNASPETVTIRLRGMPTEPRTNATTRLAYSLLSARTPEGLLNGGGTVVRDLNDNQFERCEQSTFEAPLKDLTDEEPVNYYRIKVHFIFDK